MPPRRNTFVIAAACACIAAASVAYLFVSARTSSAGGVARAIVTDCARSGADHAACYEEEVPALYPRMSVSQIFDVIRAVRSDDATYQFCHVLGHKLGERVVSEDPSGWVDAIPLNPPDGLCSNGFIHGVVGGRFRAEVLNDATIEQFMPDFTRACAPHGDWNPSDLDRAICYHGMGHLFDFITNADIPKALSLCGRITEDYRRVCVQGVFMQIYQPLEPDDYELIAQMSVKPSSTTVPEYCAAFSADPIAEGSCVEESWPLFHASITDGTGVARLCSLEPNAEEQNVCYVSMSSIIGRLSLGDPQHVARACAQFPLERQADCFGYSAEAVLEENRNDAAGAIALCGLASSAVGPQCIGLLADHARFIFGPDVSAQRRFCSALPNEFAARCASR
jgi:hypothetical protein